MNKIIYQLNSYEALQLNEALNSLSYIFKMIPNSKELSNINIDELNRIINVLNEQNPIEEVIRIDISE